jgi:hypothetical protein
MENMTQRSKSFLIMMLVVAVTFMVVILGQGGHRQELIAKFGAFKPTGLCLVNLNNIENAVCEDMTNISVVVLDGYCTIDTCKYEMTIVKKKD